MLTLRPSSSLIRHWPWTEYLSLGIGRGSNWLVWLWPTLDFPENSSTERDSFLNITFSLRFFQLYSLISTWLFFFFCIQKALSGCCVTNKKRWQQPPNHCRKGSIFILPFYCCRLLEILLGEMVWNWIKVIGLSIGNGCQDFSLMRHNSDFDAKYQELYHYLKKITCVWNNKKPLEESG